MKSLPPTPLRNPRGVTLVESIIAVGVLAVAIPLVFGSIAESGKSGMSSQAETRATWIVPVCMEEIRASRNGKPEYFTATKVGETFPPSGSIWALAFSPDGSPVGKLDKGTYDQGTRELNGKPVLYIANLESQSETTKTGNTPMLKVRITLEYPAAAPQSKRQTLDFHTRVP